MKWSIPAKTFFVGEYIAMAGAPAIVLTTKPCFEITLTPQPGLDGIHPDSPAGQYWLTQHHNKQYGLSWHDPYAGKGGLGASSAQWLGAYYACHYLQQKSVSPEHLLDAYFESAWQGKGSRPSGYDVIAQTAQGSVYINHRQQESEEYHWPFHDLAFILVHTGQKLATHHHLQSIKLTHDMQPMSSIVESAKRAFKTTDSLRVIDAVNAYHHHLLHHGLVATHSLTMIQHLQQEVEILAAKGCGAMGADVILLLVAKHHLLKTREYLVNRKMNVLATSEDIYQTT